MKRSMSYASGLALSLVSTSAIAHPGHFEGSGASEQVLHFFGGAEHLIALGLMALPVLLVGMLIVRRASRQSRHR